MKEDTSMASRRRSPWGSDVSLDLLPVKETHTLRYPCPIKQVANFWKGDFLFETSKFEDK